MLVHSHTWLLHNNLDNFNFWILNSKLVHLCLLIDRNLVYNFVICFFFAFAFTVQNIVFCDVCAFALTIAEWADWRTLPYCCFVWLFMRQTIGSLKSLRHVPPKHNKVLSSNQSLSVYSSGTVSLINDKFVVKDILLIYFIFGSFQS